MANVKVKNIGVNLSAEAAPPVVVLTPKGLTLPVQTLVTFDAQQSYSTDNSSLTYLWELDTPKGSHLSSTDLFVSESKEQARLYPDVVGEYTVSLTIQSANGGVAHDTAVLFAAPSNIPIGTREAPDGSLMFKIISNFWKMCQQSEVLPIIWSAYSQSVGSDLLRSMQLMFSKSIKTIEPLKQVRWMSFSPLLSIKNNSHTLFFVERRSGSSAFTLYGSLLHRAIILSSTELYTVSGQVKPTAAGENLTLHSMQYGGVYVINSVISKLLKISNTTKLPVQNTVKETHNTLVCFKGSTVMHTTAVNTIEVGDIVQIQSGGSKGYYEVIATFATEPTLPNNRYFRVKTPASTTESNLSASVYFTVIFSAPERKTAMTDTVYIPAQDFPSIDDLKPVIEGAAEFVSKTEVILPQEFVNESLLGATLQIRSGAYTGETLVLASINGSRTGYITSTVSPISAGTVLFKISSTKIPASKFLLQIDGLSHKVKALRQIDSASGSFVEIILYDKRAVSNKSGLSWRLSPVLQSVDGIDYARKGVSIGDTLVFEVSSSLTSNRGVIYGRVSSCVKDSIGFEWGETTPAYGQVGSFATEELKRLASGLGIGTVSEGDTGTVFGASALVINEAIEEGALSSYKNIPILVREIDRDTMSGMFTIPNMTSFSVKPVAILRASKVLLDSVDPVVSVPILTEYIRPILHQDNGAGYTYVGKDNQPVLRSRAEVVLKENIDYFLSVEQEIYGADMYGTEGGTVLTSQSGNFISKQVVPGDTITVGSDVYTIVEAIDEATLSVMNVDGTVGLTSSYNKAIFSVSKQDESFDSYLTFSSTLFSDEFPPPLSLWAEVVYVDNSRQIEDNFGALVGYNRTQFYDFSSPQNSYKNAVKGLMFALTHGPRVEACDIAAHILLNLPVAEVAGRITTIDKNAGKIVLQEYDKQLQQYSTRLYTYSYKKGDVLDIFKEIATNPTTGQPLKIGDVVDAFSFLTRRVVITDRIIRYETDPTDLEQWHTWYIEIDSSATDSRDIPFLREFMLTVKPVHTKMHIILYLYLVDEVLTEMDLYLALNVYLYDNPTSSMESTGITDSFDGSGVAQRLFDIGSFSTRTVFQGDDLSITANSASVISLRGGFLEDNISPQVATNPYISADTRELPYINRHFNSPVLYKGRGLVSPGDILYIHSGLNEGRYNVVSVVSDTEITIEEAPGLPPRSVSPAGLQDQTDAYFTIHRKERLLVLEGLTVSSSTGGRVDSNNNSIAGYTTVLDEQDLLWEGVTIGDELVSTTSPVTERHVIVDVPYDPLVTVNTATLITETQVSPANFGHEFVIYRPSLASTTISTFGATFSVSDRKLTVTTGNLLGIQTGDYIEIVDPNSPFVGKRSRVIGPLLDTEIYIKDNILSTNTTVSLAFRVLRDVQYDGSDSDAQVENVLGTDKVYTEISTSLSIFSVSLVSGFIYEVSHPTAGYFSDPDSVNPNGLGLDIGDYVIIESGVNILEGYVHDISTNGMTLTVYAVTIPTAITGTFSGTFRRY